MRAERLVLAAVAVSNLATGLLALLAPRAFYDHFPFGAGWVAALPPYNQHLTTDAGAFFLAFGLLLAWAAWRMAPALVVPVCAAWTVVAAVHLTFHVTHLDGLSSGDQILQTTGLAAALAPAVVAVKVR